MSDGPKVALLDYGSGNIHSAQRALERAGAQVRVTTDRDEVLNADGLVVPGVGAFAAVMEGLSAVKGGELIGRRADSGRPRQQHRWDHSGIGGASVEADISSQS